MTHLISFNAFYDRVVVAAVRPRPAGWWPVEPGGPLVQHRVMGAGGGVGTGRGARGPPCTGSPAPLGPESGEEVACQEFLSVLGRPQPAQDVPGRLREGGGGVGARQGGGGGGHRAGRAGLLMQ